MAAVRIRLATIDDAPGIAAVNVRAWQTAYRGILPDSFLDALDVTVREERVAAGHRSRPGRALHLRGRNGWRPSATAIAALRRNGPERDGLVGGWRGVRRRDLRVVPRWPSTDDRASAKAGRGCSQTADRKRLQVDRHLGVKRQLAGQGLLRSAGRNACRRKERHDRPVGPGGGGVRLARCSPPAKRGAR